MRFLADIPGTGGGEYPLKLLRLTSGLLTAALFTVTACNGGAAPSLDARHFFQSGNELRIIVETSVKTSAFWSHSTTTSKSKGWLVCVDLASDKPIRQRTRVYGPLWDTPNAHTGFDGLIFTKEDQEAAAATALVAFDHEGNIVRIQGSAKAGPKMRSFLQISNSNAVWQPQGQHSAPPEQLRSFAADAVETSSHRYELRYGQDGSAALYERLSGKPVEKPWLTKAFATYRGMKDMDNVRAWLSEDLSYLICFPAPGPTEFEWAGKTYPRKDYAFLFHEPESAPVIFRRPPLEGGVWGQPDDVFLIDGRPYMHDKAETKVVLSPILGEGLRYQLETTPLQGWVAYDHSRVQHVVANDQLVSFVDDFHSGVYAPSDNFIVFIWNYRKNEVERHEAHIREVFRNFLGEFSPHAAIKPVEK